MGWKAKPAPSLMEAAQDRYLERLEHAYRTDAITAEELDVLTGHVVAGGHLGRRLEPLDAPPAGSALAAAFRRGYAGASNAGAPVVLDGVPVMRDPTKASRS